MIKPKKSQVTLFMLLGIVLLITIGIFIYLNNSTSSKRTDEETKAVQQLESDIQPIKKYVKSCVERVGEFGLFLIGRQGGYLLRQQEAQLPEYARAYYLYTDTERNLDYTIFYSTKKPIAVNGIITDKYNNKFNENPYLYPNETFPVINADGSTSFYGYFYESRFEESVFKEEGIVDSLIRHIDSDLQGCLDFSIFTGYNFTNTDYVKEDISVFLDENDVVVRFKYPLMITKTDGKASIQLEDTFVTFPVRLKKIQAFMTWLLEQDTTDILFDISDHTNEGMMVSINNNFNGRDDLINLSDSLSILRGRPYDFWVMRHNRNPAAYSTYYETDRVFHVEEDITEADVFPNYDFYMDPDEDTLFYNILYCDSDIGCAADGWQAPDSWPMQLTTEGDYHFRYYVYDADPMQDAYLYDYEDVKVTVNENNPNI